jgi:hypothetical protein
MEEQYGVEELEVSGTSARYGDLTTAGYNYNDSSDCEESSGSSDAFGDRVPAGSDDSVVGDGTAHLSGEIPVSSMPPIPLTYSVSVMDGLDENSPDPFRNLSSSSAHIPYSSTHAWAPIRILYLMAIWLHAYHHVSFRIIGAILSVVRLILAFLINSDPSEGILSAVTLTTVHSCMEVEPDFQILPVCPVCQELYPALTSTPDFCLKCAKYEETTRLFDVPQVSQTSKRRHGPLAKRREPRLRFSFKSVSHQLEELLMQPGMEELLDEWRRLPNRHPELGIYQDIFDGRVACTILGPDGQPFFHNEPEDRLCGPDNELRIGLTLGADWYELCYEIEV